MRSNRVGLSAAKAAGVAEGIPGLKRVVNLAVRKGNAMRLDDPVKPEFHVAPIPIRQLCTDAFVATQPAANKRISPIVTEVRSAN